MLLGVTDHGRDGVNERTDPAGFAACCGVQVLKALQAIGDFLQYPHRIALLSPWTWGFRWARWQERATVAALPNDDAEVWYGVRLRMEVLTLAWLEWWKFIVHCHRFLLLAQCRHHTFDKDVHVSADRRQ